MHDYWLYVFDEKGRPYGPPIGIAANDDRTAIARAMESHDERLDAELRDGERLVKRISRKR